jgi:excisionase family DNA binding protein
MKQSKIQEKLDEIINLLKDQEDKPMSVREVCKYLNLTSSYVYKLSSLGILLHYKPNGKRIFFKKSEIDKWLFQNRIGTKEEIKKKLAKFERKQNISNQKT